MTLKVLPLVLLFLLAACASSHVIIGTPRPPIDPTTVKLYTSPPPKFEEIAIIEASSKSSWAISDQGKMDKVIERLKEEAAALGANGILIQGLGSQVAGSVGTGVATGTNNTAFGTGVSGAIFHKQGSGVDIFVPTE